VENVLADHLSRIPNAPVEITPINENFPNEHILAMCNEPWYAHIMNYLSTGQISSDWSSQDRHHFFHLDTIFLLTRIVSSNAVLIKS